MTEERRYGREEAARIFEAAASERLAPPRDAPNSDEDGLTLEELQAIGKEVGMPPERIAAAAHALEKQGRKLPRKAILGIPYTVGHVVDLPRAPTDVEWEVILSELRSTFSARGKDLSTGAVRHWANSNLHAYIEPVQGGYRMRLTTRKGDASAVNVVAVWGVMFGLFIMSTEIASAGLAGAFADAVFYLLLGIAAVTFNAIRLPRWAETREEQMAHVAREAQALLSGERNPSSDATW